MVVERRASPQRPDKQDKMIALVSKVRSVSADIVTSRAGSRKVVVCPWLLSMGGEPATENFNHFTEMVKTFCGVAREQFSFICNTPTVWSDYLGNLNQNQHITTIATVSARS